MMDKYNNQLILLLNIQQQIMIVNIYKMSFQDNQQSSKLKDLNNIDVSQQSPRFGVQPPHKNTHKVHQVHKPGLYGQSQHQFIQQSKSHPVHNQHRKISKKQLESHKSAQSAWISLKGIVYDVTSYIHHHPGGQTLLEGCGKQSQKLFNENHSWVNARNILANCIIGVLDEN